MEILKFHLELYNFQVEMNRFLLEILTTCLVFNPYFEQLMALAAIRGLKVACLSKS